MHFAIPDFVLKDVYKQSNDPLLRGALKRTLEISKRLRKRSAAPLLDHPANKSRAVYDMEHGTDSLPGKLVREEGSPDSADKVINWAYDNAGIVYDYYAEVHGRDSLDGHGMKIISSVHFDNEYDNAYWNGSQIVYGDGKLFYPLCRDLNVSGHEFSHAITPLVYFYEPGALNEHLADVFGMMAKQRYLGHDALQASWLIGEDIVTDKFPGKALRTCKDEKAYRNDPQPKHMKNRKFGPTEFQDNFGVHIYSGIPNRAYFEFATMLYKDGVDAHAFGTAAEVWYDTMTRKVGQFTSFKDFRQMTMDSAREKSTAQVVNLLEKAWTTVGL